MHIKNFLSFLSEGLYKDRNDLILSIVNKDSDILKTSTAAPVKGKGLTKKGVFELFYGLESDNTTDDLNDPEVKPIMNTLKSGNFKMGKLQSGQEELLSTFIKKTSGDKYKDSTTPVKYIVEAESSDKLVSMMAESLQKSCPGSIIIKLKKAVYDHPDKLLKDAYKLASDSYNKSRKEQIEEMEELISKTKFAKSNATYIVDAMRRIDVEGRPGIKKIDSKMNHLRIFLNTKYAYTPEFVDAVQKCLNPNMRSKLVILDDNTQSGKDFTEIMDECTRICDLKKESKEEVKTENVFGYVLYMIKSASKIKK
jgi:hypothetical protein